MEVANAYLEEHGARDPLRRHQHGQGPRRRGRRVIARDPKKFRELLFAQAGLRDLPVAYVINGKAEVQVAAIENEQIPYLAPPTRTDHGGRTRTGAAAHAVRPVPRLGADEAEQIIPDSYLYVARGVSPKVVRHLRRRAGGRRRLRGTALRLRGRLKVHPRPDVLHDRADGAVDRDLGRPVVRGPHSSRRSGA